MKPTPLLIEELFCELTSTLLHLKSLIAASPESFILITGNFDLGDQIRT